MSTVIYYFSGTGNSLHAARELQKQIPGAKLVSMLNLLHNDTIKTEADTVGFVFPVYLINLPLPVKQFIRKLDLSSTRYIFLVVTCIGFTGFPDIIIDEILRKKKKKLDFYSILYMANNSPAGARPFADKDWDKYLASGKISQLEIKVEQDLILIKNAVINKEHNRWKGLQYLKRILLSSLLSPLYFLSEHLHPEIKYYADEECDGCGICEKVCLSGRIKLKEHRPVWQKDMICYLCYACFNFCPKQSVLLRNIYTDKKGRYWHPGITARDIAAQKRK